MDNPAPIPIAFLALLFLGVAFWYRSLRPRVDASVRAIAAACSIQRRTSQAEDANAPR